MGINVGKESGGMSFNKKEVTQLKVSGGCCRNWMEGIAVQPQSLAVQLARDGEAGGCGGIDGSEDD